MPRQRCSKNIKWGSPYILQEDFKNTTSLLVDKTGDTLDTATASKTTNGRFSDT